MNHQPARITGVIFAFLLLGCKPEPEVDEQRASDQIARAYCDQVFDCKCIDSAGFSSVEACYSTVINDLRTQQGDAVAGSLVYDPACVAEQIDRVESVGCSRDPEEIATCNDCFVYHGLLPERSPCERVGPFSTCNQGMTCSTIIGGDGEPRDICTPACKIVGKGQGCAYAGDGYQLLYECDEGLWCDSTASGLCMELPGPGFACFDGAACRVGAWCDASVETPVCAELKANGDGCSSDIECESTWCRNGLRCDDPFAEGTPCVVEDDRCDVGLYCPDNYPFCSRTDALLCAAPLTGF